MAASRPSRDDSLRTWEMFAQRHRGHPALREETVYALPIPLIDALRKEAPGLLSAEEDRFERDLADSSGSGFFLKRPFVYQLLPRADSAPLSDEDRAWRERQSDLDRRIRELQIEDMMSRGVSKGTIEELFRQQAVVKQRTLDRQRGYAGSLVTTPLFHRSCQKFRERWRHRIRRAGALPQIPLSLAGELPKVNRRSREFHVDYMVLYRQWSLDRLNTWELPTPMRPQLVGHSLYHLTWVSEGGLTLFAPWYLLADKDLKLHELAENSRLGGTLRHLDEWLDGPPQKFGHRRFSVMLELYVYLELALRRRFGSEMRHQVGKIEAALSRFMLARGRDCEDSHDPPHHPQYRRKESEAPDTLHVDTRAETLRKIRQEMERRLKRCREGENIPPN